MKLKKARKSWSDVANPNPKGTRPCPDLVTQVGLNNQAAT